MMDDQHGFAGDLAKLRQSIDILDAAMVHLLAERFRCTHAIGELKARYCAGDIPVRARQWAGLCARLRRQRRLLLSASRPPYGANDCRTATSRGRTCRFSPLSCRPTPSRRSAGSDNGCYIAGITCATKRLEPRLQCMCERRLR